LGEDLDAVYQGKGKASLDPLVAENEELFPSISPYAFIHLVEFRKCQKMNRPSKINTLYFSTPRESSAFLGGKVPKELLNCTQVLQYYPHLNRLNRILNGIITDVLHLNLNQTIRFIVRQNYLK
jgi:hypothetical protein